MKKSKVIGIIVFAVVFVALLLCATFLDLQINEAIGNSNSIFGQFFRYTGELIGWLAIAIGGLILFAAIGYDTKAKIVVKVIWAIIALVGFILTVKYTFEQFTGVKYGIDASTLPYRLMIIYEIIIALVLTICGLFWVSKAKKETIAKLAIFACILILSLAISQVVTEILKKLWSRLRFRNLDVGNGGTSAEGFTPWYKPNFGKNKEELFGYVEDASGMPQSDAYKSFPSGHTASAALTFSLIVIPALFDNLKKYRVVFYIVPICFTLCVAISRMVNRAHYLSDVTFGGTIGILSVYASYCFAKLFIKNAQDKKFTKGLANFLGIDTTIFWKPVEVVATVESKVEEKVEGEVVEEVKEEKGE